MFILFRKEKEEKERIKKALQEIKKERELKGEDVEEAVEEEDSSESPSKRKVKKKKFDDFVTTKKVNF